MRRLLTGNHGKAILIVVIAAVVLVVAGTGVFVLKGRSHGKAEKKETKHEETLVSLPEFVLNLADADQARYLKLEVNLGVTGDAPAGGGGGHGGGGEDPRMPVIRDTIIRVASSHTYSELLKPEGKEKLKDEIREALEKACKGLEVENVYFTSFAMQ